MDCCCRFHSRKHQEECNAAARFAKSSPLCVLYQQEKESFTWEDSAMRVIELSLEEDESLSPCNACSE